jgi:hypothetical protein
VKSGCPILATYLFLSLGWGATSHSVATDKLL